MMDASLDATLLQGLAAWVCGFGPEQITAKAVSLARTAIIDTLGVALAGAAEPCVAALLRTPGVADAPGPCVVFGTDRKTSTLDAAFVNGTASHALDYDDFSQPLGGHQSVPLVAPLFAVAEPRHLSGAQLIRAYVVGLETEIRLARAVNPVLPDEAPAHPHQSSVDVASLCPNAEITVFPWRETPELKARTIYRVRTFLLAHRSAR